MLIEDYQSASGSATPASKSTRQSGRGRHLVNENAKYEDEDHGGEQPKAASCDARAVAQAGAAGALGAAKAHDCGINARVFQH